MTARWSLRACCPTCSKCLWWRKLADALTRAAFLALGSSTLPCKNCGDVTARHVATRTHGQRLDLRTVARGIAHNDTKETGT